MTYISRYQSKLFSREELDEMKPEGCFTFDEALRRMRQGKMVRRVLWEDYVWDKEARREEWEYDRFQYARIISKEEAKQNRYIRNYYSGESGEEMHDEYIVFGHKLERIGEDWWSPMLSGRFQDDVLADDWYECDKDGNPVEVE